MKKNIQYLSILNVFAAIAVVYMHTQFAFYAFSNDKYWFIANMIRSIMYFCVPIFKCWSFFLYNPHFNPNLSLHFSCYCPPFQ